jgi:hypothetical protein
MDESEALEPPQAPLDRGDRADVEEKQLLEGERLARDLVLANFGYEMVVAPRAEEVEVLPVKRPQGAQPLEYVH